MAAFNPSETGLNDNRFLRLWLRPAVLPSYRPGSAPSIPVAFPASLLGVRICLVCRAVRNKLWKGSDSGSDDESVKLKNALQLHLALGYRGTAIVHREKKGVGKIDASTRAITLMLGFVVHFQHVRVTSEGDPASFWFIYHLTTFLAVHPLPFLDMHRWYLNWANGQWKIPRARAKGLNALQK